MIVENAGPKIKMNRIRKKDKKAEKGGKTEALSAKIETKQDPTAFKSEKP